MHKFFEKSQGIQDHLNNLSIKLFGISVADALNSNTCVDCKGPATSFVDKISEDEYGISALCQNCQNKMFRM